MCGGARGGLPVGGGGSGGLPVGGMRSATCRDIPNPKITVLVLMR